MIHYCVYCHKNKINEKRYIGRTNNIKRRWESNGKHYKPDKNKNQNIAFWNAIQKWGWDNFEHIILADNLTYNESLELEKYYIKYYETFIGFETDRAKRKGYNSTLGGEGTVGFAGKLHHNYGTHISESQRQLLSEIRSKPIWQYSKDGILIKEWKSEKEACENMNINCKTLWQCLNGERKTYKNSVWRYKGKSFNQYEIKPKNMSGENHPMYGKKHTEKSKKQMSKNRTGKTALGNNPHAHKVYYDGMVFGSIRECSNYINVKYQTLVSWLSGQNTMPEIYHSKQLMYYENKF